MHVRSVADVDPERNAESRFRALASVQTGWVAVLTVGLWVLGAFTVESFYVLSYLGLVVTAHLFAPATPSARRWRLVRWVVRLGFLGLCYFVAVRATSVLGL